MQNRISYSKRIIVLLGCASILVGTISSADSATNLLDLFRKRNEQKADPVKNAPTFKLENRKRISAPKIYNYKPDSLVAINFTKIDFQAAADAANTPQSDNIVPFLKNCTLRMEPDIREAVSAFYAQKQSLIWSRNGQPTAAARQMLTYFDHAFEDGLIPDDYKVDIPDSGLQGDEKQQAFVDFDVLLSARALRYVKDAGQGRIIADRLSAYYDLPRPKINLSDVLLALSQSDVPDTILASYQPQSPWYKALKVTLAALNEQKEDENIIISANTVIHPGQENNELANVVKLILREAPQDYLDTYKSVLDSYQSASLYDPSLEPAIKAFQKLSGKADDGIIGPSTINMLNGLSNTIKRERVVYAMERLRWLPHDFPSRYVFVNQSAFMAQYFEEGRERLNMKVVVGSPANQTYFFYDNIRLVTFNPSWGVPRSIIINEMLPRIAADPSYLSRNGYEVYNRAGQRVSADDIDWNTVASTGGGVDIKQSPGRNNALGELKILFPNKHDIYLHDTPNKAAFSRDNRAISHGCVRLEKPREMAAAVMGMPVEGLKPYFGAHERNFQLSETVPVYLVYFTAWPDFRSGKIEFYDDAYHRDDEMKKAFEKTTESRANAG